MVGDDDGAVSGHRLRDVMPKPSRRVLYHLNVGVVSFKVYRAYLA
jgi:hypothetical protein